MSSFQFSTKKGGNSARGRTTQSPEYRVLVVYYVRVFYSARPTILSRSSNSAAETGNCNITLALALYNNASRSEHNVESCTHVHLFQ